MKVKRILCLLLSLLLFTSCGMQQEKDVEEVTEVDKSTEQETETITDSHGHSHVAENEIVNFSFDVSKYAKDLVVNMMADVLLEALCYQGTMYDAVKNAFDGEVHYFEIDDSKVVDDLTEAEFNQLVIDNNYNIIEYLYISQIADVTEDMLLQSDLFDDSIDEKEKETVAELFYDYLHDGYICYYFDIAKSDFSIIYTKENIYNEITSDIVDGIVEYNDSTCGAFNYHTMMTRRFQQYHDNNGSYYDYVAKLIFSESEQWVKREQFLGSNIDSGWYVFSVSILDNQYTDASFSLDAEVNENLKQHGILYGYTAVHIVNDVVLDAYYYDTDVFSDIDINNVPSYIGHYSK